MEAISKEFLYGFTVGTVLCYAYDLCSISDMEEGRVDGEIECDEIERAHRVNKMKVMPCKIRNDSGKWQCVRGILKEICCLYAMNGYASDAVD